MLAKMFSLAEFWEIPPLGRNPCKAVRRYKVEPHKERFLASEEFTQFGRALDAAPAEHLASRHVAAAILKNSFEHVSTKREIAMIFHRQVVSASLLIFVFVYPALAQECYKLSEKMKRAQQALYEYALISEAAYGQTPSNSCPVDATPSRIEMPDVEKRPLLSNMIDTKWKPEILERWQANHLGRPNKMGRYIGEDGVTYVTCTYDDLEPQFALTWTEFRRTREDDDEPSKIDVYVEIRPVIPTSSVPRSEEIGIIRLRRDPLSNNIPEELVAIRGTDFTRIPQIMASLHHLLSGSCVYEMAAIVVEIIGNALSTGRVSVVGHSLGGGAVQYIVRDHTFHPWRNPTN